MTRSFRMLRRLGTDERGVIAVVFAIMFPVVAAILAIGIETGIWYDVKRHNQAIADVAAYSGALEIVAGGTCASGWSGCPTAQNDANANGFDVTASANLLSTLTVGNEACGGGTCQTVTVTLKHQQAPLMVRYFLGDYTFPIVNQAKAQILTTNACLSGVAPTGVTYEVKGGAPTIDLPDCTITSNSTDPKSFNFKGSGSLTAYSVYTAGGIVRPQNMNLTVPPTTGATPLCDPYDDTADKCGGNVVNIATSPANLTTFAMPALPSSAAPSNWNSLLGITSSNAPAKPTTPAAPASQTGSGTCSPGTTFVTSTYCYTTKSLITISGSNTLAGAVYSFQGPVAVAAGATVNFITGSAFSLNSAGTLTINGVVDFTGTSGTVYIANGNLSATASSFVSFSGGTGSTYAFKTATGGNTITLAGTTTFGPASYAFYSAALALNGTTTFQAGPPTTNVYVSGGNLTTAAGSFLTFAGGGASNYALNATAGNCAAGASYCLGGVVSFGNAANYALYGGGLTIGSGANVGFAPANYYVDSGSLTVNGCAAFQAGTMTVNINAGNLTGGATGSVNFNPNTTVCGTSYASATSQYSINTGGSGHGVTLGGPAILNPGTYYFINSNSGGTGVAINAGTAGSPITLGGGIYSIENGNLSIIGSGANASFGAATTCSPTGGSPPAGSCLYIANGAFSNAGTATFANGTYYLYAPGASGSFTNTGTLTLGSSGTNTFYVNNPNGTFSNAGTAGFGAGTYYLRTGTGGFSSTSTTANALTFTGDTTTSSNYYFIIPSGSGGVGGTHNAFDLGTGATAGFGAATYYIVNGNLTIGNGATLTCPNCAVDGAGDTFVLTGTGSGATLTNNIGGVLIGNTPNATISATLNAPGSGNYKGLLVYQDRNAPLGTINADSGHCSNNCNALDVGTTNISLTGAIYLPQGIVDFEGGHSSANCLVLIDAGTTFQANVSLIASGCQAAGVATLTTNTAVLTQ